MKSLGAALLIKRPNQEGVSCADYWMGLISLIIGGRGSLWGENNFPSYPITSFNPFLNSHRVRVLYLLFIKHLLQSFDPYLRLQPWPFNAHKLDTLCSIMGCNAILGSYYWAPKYAVLPTMADLWRVEVPSFDHTRHSAHVAYASHAVFFSLYRVLGISLVRRPMWSTIIIP